MVQNLGVGSPLDDYRMITILIILSIISTQIERTNGSNHSNNLRVAGEESSQPLMDKDLLFVGETVERHDFLLEGHRTTTTTGNNDDKIQSSMKTVQAPSSSSAESLWKPIKVSLSSENEILDKKRPILGEGGGRRRLGGDDEDDVFYYYLIESASMGGCIEVPMDDDDSNDDDAIAPGMSLIFGRCDYDTPPLNQVWKINETTGMFHIVWDDSMCMQAGHDDGKHGDGVWIRINKCDVNNEFQKFLWEDFEAPIHPKDREDLCVVSAGETPDLDVDPIILKTCNRISEYRLEWSGDNVMD